MVWSEIGAVTGIVAFMLGLFGWAIIMLIGRELEKHHKNCGIVQVITDVQVLNTKMKVFWDNMSQMLVDGVRRSSETERDTLADRFASHRDSMSINELHTLSTLLRNELIEEKPKDTSLILLIALVKAEAAVKESPIVGVSW